MYNAKNILEEIFLLCYLDERDVNFTSTSDGYFRRETHIQKHKDQKHKIS